RVNKSTSQAEHVVVEASSPPAETPVVSEHDAVDNDDTRPPAKSSKWRLRKLNKAPGGGKKKKNFVVDTQVSDMPCSIASSPHISYEPICLSLQ
ncbi:hypothetical protein IWQ62_003686, partial [Dispira parvispora]